MNNEPLIVDGTPLIAPCMAVEIYVDETEPAELTDFCERSLEALSGHIRFWHSSTTKPARLTAAALKRLPDWIEDHRLPVGTENGFFLGELERGAGGASVEIRVSLRKPGQWKPEGRRNVFRTLQAQPSLSQITGSKGPRETGVELSLLRVTFPLTHPLAQGERLLAWLKDLAVLQADRWVCGSAGLALNVFSVVGDADLRKRMNDDLGRRLEASPACDLELFYAVRDRLLVFDVAADDLAARIKRAQWLNLVRETAWHRLDPAAQSSIAHLAGPWQPANGRLLIAQSEPSWKPTPALTQLASVLRPIRVPRLPATSSGLSQDAMDQWLNAPEASPN